MKIKGKIIIMMMVYSLVILTFLGATIYFNQLNSIDELTETNIQNSAEAYGLDISDSFKIYEDIIYVVGHDQTLYSAEVSDATKAAAINRYAQAFGFVSGNILNSSGVSLDDGTDFSDREYVQRALAGEVNISSVSKSKLTGKYGYSIAGPLYDARNNVIGCVYFRQEVDGILENLSNIELSDNCYAYILDADGNVIVHPNQDLINVENVNSVPEFTQMFSDINNGNTSGATEYDYDGTEMECGYSVIDHTDGWVLVVTAPATDFTREITKLGNVMGLIEVIAILISVAVAIVFGSMISRPIVTVKDNLEKLANGDFSGEIKSNKTSSKNELALLTNSCASLQNSLSGLITEANSVLGNMSNYDLTVPDMNSYPGEFNTMAESVNHIKRMMNNMIRSIQEAVLNVKTGAGEIADATTNLSQGTLDQASSIQQMVVSIDEVSSQTQNNSDNGSVVNKKLRHLDELIRSSDEQMKELRTAVIEIEEMSGDIQKIVSDIDSISFQTNILALNASVEAARAGESGKGFAVVADEVGSLANKSADSSKKTAELIEKCISSINKAKKCADETFDSLHEIVSNSSDISIAFDEIAVSTEQQAVNAKSIKQEINKISDVVQTNTATAEQTAASTQVLSGEAENLQELIRKFRV